MLWKEKSEIVEIFQGLVYYLDGDPMLLVIGPLQREYSTTCQSHRNLLMFAVSRLGNRGIGKIYFKYFLCFTLASWVVVLRDQHTNKTEFLMVFNGKVCTILFVLFIHSREDYSLSKY